jgi:glycosyltransferase involved in cell wall biosynthesis
MLNDFKEYIFICGNLYPHQIGGAEVFNHYLINELQTKVRTTVISQWPRPNDLKTERFLRIPTFPPRGLFLSIGIFFFLLFTNTKKSKIVLSFSKSHWINWCPYFILKKIKGLDYVTIIHSGDLRPWSCNFVYQNLFKHSSQVIGVSERICIEYQKRTGKKVFFLPPLIPFEATGTSKKDARKKLGLPLNAKIILSVGSLKQMKNPDTILNAFGYLGKDFMKSHQIYVVYVGEGILRAQLEEVVLKNQFESHFHFTGSQSREIIPFYYQASDVFILCSDYEGKPLSLLEAMKYNLEIITSDSQGIKEIVDEFNGSVFEVKNFESLAKQLDLVLTDPGYSPKYKEANEIFNRKYAYGNFLESFFKMSK